MTSSYIKTPLQLKNRHSLCNIKTDDNMSFAYSVLASFYPAKTNKSRVQHYKQYLRKLNLQGIEFPMKIDSIPQFEAQNSEYLQILGFILKIHERFF